MSLFKRRGPTQEEIARENEVKRGITKELSSAIKTLQKEHLASNEPTCILSTDSANLVCSVIEAVFLHGIKDSVSKKIASYMSLNQNSDGNTGSFNFWQFVLKFTHSDVATQLKRLGQIYTEIGLCRAWVRVALNDGLIESYVDSMLADKKTLEYFYHRTAYLRDNEQPGILKSYLKGLMLLEFKLSYNSSVLNTWTNTPLSLAGIIDSHDTPLPVIHSARDKSSSSKQPVQSNGDNIDGTLEVRSVRTRSRSSTGGSVSDVTSGKKKVKEKTNKQSHNICQKSAHDSLNGDVYASDLTRKDVEEIRGKYAMGSSPHGTEISECSTSSHISCPDPVKYNKNPSILVAAKETNDVIFNLSDDRTLDSDDTECHITQPISSDFKSNVSEAEHNIDTQPNFIHHSMHLNDTAEKELGLQSMEKKRMPDITHSPISNFTHDSIAEMIKSSSVMSNNKNDKLDKPIDCTLFNRVSPSETFEERLPSEIGSSSNLNNISSSVAITKPKTSKSKGKKHKLKPNLSPPNKTPVMPALSTATADSVDTRKYKLSKQRLSMPDIRVFQGHGSSPSLMGAISEPDVAPDSKPRSESVGNVVNIDEGEESQDIIFGNSLGARSGWSSSFDLEATDTIKPLQSPPEDCTDDGIPIRRSKAESFGSMLKNYTPSSSTIASPSMEDVLQDLPDSNISSPIQPQYIQVQEIADNFTDDYEIVTNTMSSLINNKEDNQTQLALLYVVANEQGLDACNFQCCGCKRPIGIIYGKPRVCTFDGGYYCFECHENDDYYIPAYIIHNWDFRKHKVAKMNLKFLQDIEDQSVFDISEINYKLYEHVKEMEDIKKLREQLYYLKAYMFTCKQSIAEDFRKSMWPKEYMYETIHRYSFGDLLQVPSGQLNQSLKKSIKFATKHVYDCGLCSQKGFICEICNNPKVIYPFEVDITYRCLQCKSVFHKSCKTDSQQCPKCQRRQARKSQSEPQAETPDSTDYAYSPH